MTTVAPRPRPTRTQSDTPTATPSPELSSALRDVAFVLQMTRRVKSALLADMTAPKTAACRNEAEHLIGV